MSFEDFLVLMTRHDPELMKRYGRLEQTIRVPKHYLSTPEYPGVPWSTLEYPGEPRSTLESPEPHEAGGGAIRLNAQ